MWDVHPLGSKIKMKCRGQNTYYIIRRVGKQGTPPPKESNQPGVKKFTTGSATFLEKHSNGNQAQGDLAAVPSRVTPTKKKRQKTKDRNGAENIIKKRCMLSI